jgi:hypothetical protein
MIQSSTTSAKDSESCADRRGVAGAETGEFGLAMLGLDAEPGIGLAGGAGLAVAIASLEGIDASD